MFNISCHIEKQLFIDQGKRSLKVKVADPAEKTDRQTPTTTSTTPRQDTRECKLFFQPYKSITRKHLTPYTLQTRTVDMNK